MNLETARHHMIQQQLRTCEPMSPATVELLYADRREHYVPAALRAFACADVALPLTDQASMFTPKLETRLIEEAALQRSDKVLEIGTGSGHLAALLAEQAQQVWSIEIDPALAELARHNLAADGVANVTVIDGDGWAGLPEYAPYDAIIVSGSVADLPAAWREQLAEGGRLLAFVGNRTPLALRRLVRLTADNFSCEDLLETDVAPLRQPTTSQFVF